MKGYVNLYKLFVMIVKVCGMRDEANIRTVETLDVDWMGFIFYPSSARYVDGPVSYIPSKVKRVGVFVNEPVEILRETARRNFIEIVQLHGNEQPSYCRALQEEGFLVMKAFRISRGHPFPEDLARAYETCCDYFLFDTYTDAYGGSGRKFNWDVLGDYRGNVPFLLSGGISFDDAQAVVSFSHPMYLGIDVNSLFEISPGYKNTHLLQSFITKIRK